MSKLTQVGLGTYELPVENELYQVKFSLGVKDRVFRLVTGEYLKALAGEDQDLDDETRLKFEDVFRRAAETDDPEVRGEILQEINETLLDVFKMPAEKADVNYRKADRLLVDLLGRIKFEVWSILLTQRDLEGGVKKYVSATDLAHDPKWLLVEDELFELLTLTVTMVLDVVKKSKPTTKKLSMVIAESGSQLLT